jgi:hypothetical protein
MNGLRWKMGCAGLVCAAGLWHAGKAEGQSLGAPPTSMGTATGMPLSGTPIMPIPLAMPIPNPAYSNGAANSGFDVGGTPVQGNIFANPYAAPFFYSSLLPGSSGLGTTTSALSSTSGSSTTPTTTSTARGGGGLGAMQMGLLMMATQNPNGVGSGQMSGARSSRTQSRAKPTAQPTARTHTSSGPAGLAAHYFNRGGPHSSIPQSYYNRQTRYFP